MKLITRAATHLIVGVAALVMANTANAQEAYPTRPIKIVVGYAAGGSADAVARLISQGLSTKLGQPVIVENRPGASGNIAGSGVARLSADGYNLFLGSNASAINMTLYRNMPFDLKKDFAPVGLVDSFPNMLVVASKFPAKTVAEFIAYAKAHPGQVNFASSGAGSSTHLSGELFSARAGIKMTHIPYKGSAPALNDLVGGQVDAIFDNAPSVLPFVQSGAVRALAVTSAARQAFAPSLPTVAESGLAGFEVKSWYGLLAPRGTPSAIVRKLNVALNEVLNDEKVKQRLAALGATPEPSSPEAFGLFISSEIATWGDVVRRTGATAD